MRKSGVLILTLTSLIFLTIFSCDEEEILYMEPIDKISPKVSITLPADGELVSDTVFIKVTAFDEGGIRYVSLFIDGQEMENHRDSLAPYEFPWNTLIYEDESEHSLQAYAVDKNKNAAYSDIVTCTIDNTTVINPPEVYIVKPGEGAVVTGEVEVIVKCFSDEAIEKVELMLDDQLLEGAVDYEEPYEFIWSSLGYPDATPYSLRAQATTKSGVWAYSEPVQCMLNNSSYYPEPVVVYEVVFEDDKFIVSWSKSAETNFEKYVLYESTDEGMIDEQQIFESNDSDIVLFEVTGITPGEERYYRVLVENDLNYSSYSNIVMGKAGYEMPHGLRAYWPFNGNAEDESEHDYDGVVYGAELTQDRFGNPASAYYFDGFSYIEIPEHSDMNLEHGYTLAAWVNLKQYQDHNNIISRVNPFRDFVLQINNEKLAAHIYPSSGGYCWIYDNTSPFPLLKWTHVAVTFYNSIWKLYINGSLVNTRDCTGMMPAWTGTIMLIGGMNYSEFFNGSIDDVMVFERPLTDDEVAVLPLIQ